MLLLLLLMLLLRKDSESGTPVAHSSALASDQRRWCIMQSNEKARRQHLILLRCSPVSCLLSLADVVRRNSLFVLLFSSNISLLLLFSVCLLSHSHLQSASMLAMHSRSPPVSLMHISSDSLFLPLFLMPKRQRIDGRGYKGKDTHSQESRRRGCATARHKECRASGQ